MKLWMLSNGKWQDEKKAKKNMAIESNGNIFSTKF